MWEMKTIHSVSLFLLFLIARSGCSYPGVENQDLTMVYKRMKAVHRKIESLLSSKSQEIDFAEFCNYARHGNHVHPQCKKVYLVYDRITLSFTKKPILRHCLMYLQAYHPMEYLQFEFQSVEVDAEGKPDPFMKVSFLFNTSKNCESNNGVCDKEIWDGGEELWSTKNLAGLVETPLNPIQTPRKYGSQNAVHRLYWHLKDLKKSRKMSLLVRAWSWRPVIKTKTNMPEDCPSTIFFWSSKTKKCIHRSLTCDGVGGDLDLVPPSIGEDEFPLFTDYDLEDSIERTELAPTRDNLDESNCLSLSMRLAKRNNIDLIFQLLYFVFCGIIGTFLILSVTFYKTIFDPRRDMILEEEYEYAICTEADEDKLALRLQNFLKFIDANHADSSAVQLMTEAMERDSDGDEFKVTTDIAQLPKLTLAPDNTTKGSRTPSAPSAPSAANAASNQPKSGELPALKGAPTMSKGAPSYSRVTFGNAPVAAVPPPPTTAKPPTISSLRSQQVEPVGVGADGGGGGGAKKKRKVVDTNTNEATDNVGSITGKKPFSTKSSLEDFLSVGSLEQESITP